MNIVHVRMAPDRTEYFIKKNKIIKEFENKTILSSLKKIFEDRKEENIVDRNKSVQQDKQKGKYMVIKDRGVQDKQSVSLMYVKESEIMAKRNTVLNFKSSYLLKIQCLKYQSQKLEQLDKISKWLHRVIDRKTVKNIIENVFEPLENYNNGNNES